ncbi:MAG: DUF4340 domain-containing protein [Opitutales bacterium]|nr:DUF4340 domain-containing protein [Opitutales bacterium]MCH8540743.1 DUF4340 domain-containing protein [Opitutales bacterium]
MHTRWTLLLLVANALLFGFLLVDWQGGSEHETAVADRRILPMAIDQIESLVLEGENIADRKVIQREGEDRWRIESPVEWPANIFAVNRILNQIEELRPVTSFSLEDLQRGGTSLAEYGLEQPPLSLTIGWEGQIRTIHFGAPTGSRTRMYLFDTHHQRVHVVERALAEALSLTLNELRSNRIFSLAGYEVNTLRIQMTQPSDLQLRLTRSGTEWRYEAPFPARADAEGVSQTIGDLLQLEVLRFHGDASGDLQNFGLDNPIKQIILEGSNRRQTLLIGDEFDDVRGDREYYAQLAGRNTIFSIKAQPIDELRDARYTLRDRRIATFDPSLITDIAVEDPDGPSEVKLRKLETGQWQVQQRRDGESRQIFPADQQIVEAAIESISKLRARDFSAEGPDDNALAGFGLDEPQRIIRLKNGARDSLNLFFGDNTGSRQQNVFVKKNAEITFVFEVDASVLRQFRTSPHFYRDRNLRNLPSGATIQKLELELFDEEYPGLSISLLEDSQSWSDTIAAIIPAGHKEEREAANKLISVLRNLKVDSFTGKPFSQEGVSMDIEYPWVGRIVATLTLAGGEEDSREKVEIYFTDIIGRTLQFFGHPSEDVIFVGNPDLIQSLDMLRFYRLDEEHEAESPKEESDEDQLSEHQEESPETDKPPRGENNAGPREE